MVIECADPATCAAIAEAQRELVVTAIEVTVLAVTTWYVYHWVSADTF